MRGMMGGFLVRDLDFTVEGNPAKVTRLLEASTKAKTAASDSNRKSTTFALPSGLTFEVGMAQEATYPRPGAKPRIQPAAIHDDLRSRDFTINAMALSLNPASRGLLLDPTNGLGDIEAREIRTTGNYTLYDEPVRILRMLRLKMRLGFAISERTQSQYENVREAKLEEKISTEALYKELRAMADEPDPGALLQSLENEGLLTLFSPSLAGPKLNLSGLSKLQKLRQMIPFGSGLKVDNVGPFFWVLLEKLNAKERAALVSRLGMPKADADLWMKLEERAKKLERALKSAKLHKASLVYQLLRQTQGDQILFLLYHSQQRLVTDRLKKFLTTYLPGVLEIADKEVAAYSGIEPGSPKFAGARQDYIVGRLDGRIRKIVPAEPEPPVASAHQRR
jgi:tRNA nucleotidyltransferase/poly(A) polymerase